MSRDLGHPPGRYPSSCRAEPPKITLSGGLNSSPKNEYKKKKIWIMIPGSVAI